MRATTTGARRIEMEAALIREHTHKISNGYIRVPCPVCDNTGFFPNGRECDASAGHGYIWWRAEK